LELCERKERLANIIAVNNQLKAIQDIEY